METEKISKYKITENRFVKAGLLLLRNLSILALPVLIFLGFFMPVYIHVPKGFTEEHHSYKDALKCARSIDANAEVSEEYSDEGKFRIWNAKINGSDCHIISDPVTYFAETIFPNEILVSLDMYSFKDFYCLYSDYYLSELEEIVANNPDLDTVDLYNARVSFKNTYEEMTIEDFERVWNNYTAICEEIKSKNPTIRECDLWNKKAGAKEYDMTHTYYFEEPTEDEYAGNYNEVVINEFMKDCRYIQTGSISGLDPYTARFTADYFFKDSDRENVLTREILRSVWEEYKDITAKVQEASPYIRKSELEIRVHDDKTYDSNHDNEAEFEFTDTSEETYEEACKVFADVMR